MAINPHTNHPTTTKPSQTPAESVGCCVCGGIAERQSHTPEDDGAVSHHYRCSEDGCSAGGTIVVDEAGEYTRRVGPALSVTQGCWP